MRGATMTVAGVLLACSVFSKVQAAPAWQTCTASSDEFAQLEARLVEPEMASRAAAARALVACGPVGVAAIAKVIGADPFADAATLLDAVPPTPFARWRVLQASAQSRAAPEAVAAWLARGPDPAGLVVEGVLHRGIPVSWGAELLRHLDQDAVRTALRAVLPAPDGYDERAIRLVAALGDGGLLARLDDAYATGSHRTRVLVVQAWSTGPRDVVAPRLLRALGDEDALVRTEAARALGQMRYAQAAERVASLFENGKIDGAVAVRALGSMHATAFMPLLEKTFYSGDAVLKAAVLDAWNEMGTPESLRHLMDALTDYNDYVRHHANWLLASRHSHHRWQSSSSYQ